MSFLKRFIQTGLFGVFFSLAAFAQIQLEIDNLTVEQSFSEGGCVQVPIFLNDPDMDNRDLRGITFTLEIDDPDGVIDGGIVANMLVANGFTTTAGTGTTGLTDPGTDLVNNGSGPTPSCPAIFNRVTEGSGSAVNFPATFSPGASWLINNNLGGQGRKQGFLFDPSLGTVGNLPQNTSTLIAVLEIPIISDPGAAEISITATPNSTVTDGNTYSWDDGTRAVLDENFVLPLSPAVVTLVSDLIIAPIELKVGSLAVSQSFVAGGCIQVPITINDPGMNSRDIRDLTFTLDISDPSHVINGDVFAEMVVANGFTTNTGSGTTGLTSPGTDLANANTTPSPSCGAIYNQVTESQGPAIDFPATVNHLANWSISNNHGGTGRKQGFLFDASSNGQVATTTRNADQLIAILEIPIIASPGVADITITATPESVLPGGNVFTWENGTRSGKRTQVSEEFVLPTQAAVVSIDAASGESPIELKIGSVTVNDPLEGGGCIQVPVMINDPSINNRDLRDLTFTLELDDPSGVIAGGTTIDMIVANGFNTAGGSGTTGLTNPGTDLVNTNGDASPACGGAFNRVTEGEGSAIDFPATVNHSATWTLNNNFGGQGNKRGFLIDAVSNATVINTVRNADQLIAVLEIPIIANPGAAQISITATPASSLPDGNTYTWDNGALSGKRTLANSDFTLPSQPALVTLDPPVVGSPIELKVGSVTVNSLNFSAGGCVQVPVMINDADINNRDIRDITFTLQLDDPNGVIDGGVAANMVVANGFDTAAGTGTTGLTNPGTDLANTVGTPTPNCGVAYNQVTEGQGEAINFPVPISPFAHWNINNNHFGTGRKQAFLIDLFGNGTVARSVQGADLLLAILEIPIIANPGPALITISATPTTTVAGGNTYTFEDGLRTQIVEDFDLPAPATISFDPGDASIGDLVWSDDNGNGNRDAGEAGIAGVTLDLYFDSNGNGTIDSNEPSSTSQTTDGSGVYSFSSLIGGNYIVEVSDDNEVLTGMALSGTNPLPLTLAISQALVTADFGYRDPRTASIGGLIFNDLNGNGQVDSSESGLNDVRIFLDSNGNGSYDAGEPATLSAGGLAYVLPNLASGTYVVRIDANSLPADFVLTAGGDSLSVSLPVAGMVTDANFGFQQRNSSIGELLFNDINGNGTLDAGEPGLAEATLFLDLNGDGALGGNEPSQSTDGNGLFSFIGLAAGNYSLVIIETSLPAAYFLTSDPNSLLPSLDAGEAYGTAIGFQLQDSSLAGVVWNDVDGNAHFDPLEAGFSSAAVSLVLDGNGNGLPDAGEPSRTMVTDEHGAFLFAPLGAGEYVLTVDESGVLDPFALTTGTNPTVRGLGNSQHLTDNPFGFQYQGPCTNCIEVTGIDPGLVECFDLQGVSGDCGSGFICGDLLANTHALSCDDYGIFSVLGIEHLTQLVSLTLDNNPIQVLDLSALGELQVLSATNTELDSMPTFANNLTPTSINLSNGNITGGSNFASGANYADLEYLNLMGNLLDTNSETFLCQFSLPICENGGLFVINPQQDEACLHIDNVGRTWNEWRGCAANILNLMGSDLSCPCSANSH